MRLAAEAFQLISQAVKNVFFLFGDAKLILFFIPAKFIFTFLEIFFLLVCFSKASRFIGGQM